MIYEALPIPSTDNNRQWGVYTVFPKTGLPPRFHLASKTQRGAKRLAKDFHQQLQQYPTHRYLWCWKAVDDWTNQWWKDKDDYAREHGLHPAYREGGRVIVTDYGTIE